MRAPEVIFGKGEGACPDPIFAAIRAVRLAEVDHTQALADLNEDDEDEMCRANGACDRHAEAARALAALHPQSWDGFRELIRHYAYETDFYECGGSALEHLASIVESDAAFILRCGGKP